MVARAQLGLDTGPGSSSYSLAKVCAGDFPSEQLAQQGSAVETTHNWFHWCYLIVRATARGLLDPDELRRGGEVGGGDYAAGAGHDSDCSPSYIPFSNKDGSIGKIPYYRDSNPPFSLAAAAVDAAARSAAADVVWQCNICICMRLCVWY